MPRRRILSPDFFANEDLSPLPDFARLLYLGLVSMSDDYGKGIMNANLIRAFIWPFSEDVTNAKILAAVTSLKARPVLYVYGKGAHTYYQHPKWQFWNKLEHPQPSKIPNVPNKSVFCRYIRDADNPRGLWVSTRYLTMDLLPKSKHRKKFGLPPIRESITNSSRSIPGGVHSEAKQTEDKATQGKESEPPTRTTLSQPASDSLRSELDEHLARLCARAKVEIAFDEPLQSFFNKTVFSTNWSEASLAVFAELLEKCKGPKVKNIKAYFTDGFKRIASDHPLFGGPS